MAVVSSIQEARLRALRRDYAARLPERVGWLMAGVKDTLFTSSEPVSGARIEDLVHEAHRLCGSAAIFGFHEVSQAARGIEHRLVYLVEAERAGLGGSRSGALIRLIRQVDALEASLQSHPSEAAEPPEPARAPVAAPSTPPLRVLVADDDTDTRDLLAFHLRGAGIEVELSASGNAALERVCFRAPDVIVADIVLDGMSGYELCRLVRQMGHEVPVILCSVQDAPHERVAGLRAGADDYLAKPFEPAELLLKVRRWGRRLGERAGPAIPRPTS